MRVETHTTRTPYEFRLPNGKTLFRVEEIELSHERFAGGMSRTITRVNFERGDGVAVLLYEADAGDVILIEQFRLPVHRRANEDLRARNGWLTEIVAGIKDDDGPAVARREILEEIGHELAGQLEHLSTFYLSPGASSERLELYLATVRRVGSLPDRAGLGSEGEDIRIFRLPLAEALAQVEDGRICDAKTLIALLMLEKKLSRKD